MKRPIQAGDQCLVVGGLGRSKSPNLGLKVRVMSLQGEHSQHGRMWLCAGTGVKQLSDGGGYVTTNEACFAQDWLQRIEPPPLNHRTTVVTDKAIV